MQVTLARISQQGKQIANMEDTLGDALAQNMTLTN